MTLNRLFVCAARVALIVVCVLLTPTVNAGDEDFEPVNGCPNDLTLSDPVLFFTGDFFYDRTDFSVPGRGLSFEWKRTYRSRLGAYDQTDGINILTTPPLLPGFRWKYGSMGRNWSHPYQTRVYKACSSCVLYHFAEDGRRGSFASVGSALPTGEFEYRAAQYFDVIRYHPGTTIAKLITPDRTVYEYLPIDQTSLTCGRLKSITDRYGNTIELTYDTKGRLATVTDTMGRVYTMGYAHDGVADLEFLITSVTETLYPSQPASSKRQLVFTYCVSSTDPNANVGDLISVGLPEIVDAPGTLYDLPAEHSTAPWTFAGTSRRFWTYQYAKYTGVSTDPSVQAAHTNLTRIFNPRGELEVENIYALNLDGPAGRQCYLETSKDSRVVEQIHGGPHIVYDGSGVPVQVNEGDHYVYCYGCGFGPMPSNQDLGVSFNTVVMRVTVNNRRGQVKELIYDKTTGFLLRRRDFKDLAAPGLPSADTRDLDLCDCIHPSLPDCGVAWAGPYNAPSPSLNAYETNYVNNDDGLAWKRVMPDGRVVRYQYWTPASGQPEDRLKAGALIRQVTWRVGAYPGDFALPPYAELPTTSNADRLVEQWEYNASFGSGGGGCNCGGISFPTKHVDANGNVTEYQYDSMGRVEWKKYIAVETGTSGTPQDIVESFTYYGTEKFNKLKEHTHPSNGTAARVDRYDYTPEGFLAEKIEDYGAGGRQLTTSYEYDLAGNPTKMIDPKGTETRYLYNQLNELIRQEVVGDDSQGGQRVWSRVDYFYDANGNRVREDVANLDASGAFASNAVLTTLCEFDPTGHLVQKCQEVGSIAVAADKANCEGLSSNTGFITTVYLYDGHRNNTATLILPAGAPEPTAANILQIAERQTLRKYDARDFLIGEIHGAVPLNTSGNPIASPHKPSTTEYEYDLEGRMIKRTEAIGEGNSPRIWLYAYDGFGRLQTVTDPLGHFVEYGYDFNGNRTFEKRYGAISPGYTLLAQVQAIYDRRNRVKQTDKAIFTPTGTATLPTISSYSTVKRYFFADGSLQRVTDPKNNSTNYEYESFGPAKRITDALNNTVVYTYDDNKNVVQITQTDKSTLSNPTPPDEVFVVVFGYDPLDRTTLRVDGFDPDDPNDPNDPVGVNRTTTYAYDSRGNLVRMTDPSPTAALFQPYTEYVYDGLDRLTTTREWGSDPTTGDPILIVETEQQWDVYSRLIAQIDHGDNATRYGYDTQDRLIATRMADGTIHQIGTGITWPAGQSVPIVTSFASGYDAAGNTLTTRDANGSQVASVFDANDRVVSRTISRGPGVIGTTLENYVYDGLSRLTLAQDDDSRVTRSYDSLSRLVSETSALNPPIYTQPLPSGAGRTVAYTYDAASNVTAMTYPSGRVINQTFDSLNRLSTISSPVGGHPTTQLIAQFDFVGRSRYTKRTLGNNTTTTYTYNGQLGAPTPTMDFGFRRMSSVTHRNSAGTVIDQWTLRWDTNQNKIRRTHDAGGTSNLSDRRYLYDEIDRLAQTDVKPTGTPDTSFKFSAYTLDGIHNREKVTVQSGNASDSGAQVGNFTLTAGAPLYDREMNQYSKSPLDLIYYDQNGNVEAIQPLATGTIILQLSQGQIGSSPELWQAAQDALNQGGSAFDLARDEDLTPEDIELLLELIQQTWNPTVRLAEIRYDYRNQMVEYDDQGTPQLNKYAYDCFGRRIRRTIDATGSASNFSDFRYIYGGQAGWQVLEEEAFNPDGTVLGLTSGYVWGMYIDELIQHRWDMDGPDDGQGQGQGAPANYYYHHDDLFNVTAITISGLSGAVVERCDYGDYGKPKLRNASGSALAGNLSTVGNRYMFTGREWDTETGLYYYRTRYMDPGWGRFTGIDAIGVWGDEHNTGNGFAYVRSSPWRHRDPLGLWLDNEPIESPSNPPPKKPTRKYREKDLDTPNAPGKNVVTPGDIERDLEDLGDVPPGSEKPLHGIDIGGHGSPGRNTIFPNLTPRLLEDIRRFRENPNIFTPRQQRSLCEMDRILRRMEEVSDCIFFDSCRTGAGEEGEELLKKLKELYPGSDWGGAGGTVIYPSPGFRIIVPGIIDKPIRKIVPKK